MGRARRSKHAISEERGLNCAVPWALLVYQDFENWVVALIIQYLCSATFTAKVY